MKAKSFRIYYNQREVIEAAEPETIGKALIAALHYLDKDEVEKLSPAEKIIFNLFKVSIDRAARITAEKTEKTLLGDC